MKFLKHIRSKSRLKSLDQSHGSSYLNHGHQLKPSRDLTGPHPTTRYPEALLEDLLSYVCGHARDDAYTSCEESMTDGGCMLCDIRDLSQCALINRQWSKATQNVLYHNIRLDSVHYCQREVELAAKRKRRSFSGQHGNPPQERLQLLSRTVRENELLGEKVQFLKIPYMTREGSVADLARTISFMPNLRYVDLPDSVYTDDPLASTLKQELQSRCPNIRHMKYFRGAEGDFQTLERSEHWQGLESLELSNLTVEPSTIIDVFVSLIALYDVKLANMPLLDDDIFLSSPTSVSFPPLAKLDLQGVPNITIEGLTSYLCQPKSKVALTSLYLKDTGISVSEMHRILSIAPHLITLHVVASVNRALAPSQTPSLTSQSLKTLHYEITNASSSPGGLASSSDSYYAYLSASVLSGSLPSLSHLYALSDNPQNFLQPAPPPSQPSNSRNRRGTTLPAPLSLGITRPLHLYTKAVREMEWDLTLISPPTPAHRRGSTTATAPESLYHPAPLSPQYRNAGRNSVMVGNGFGGFLAVPSPGFVPGSPQPRKKKKDLDAWMG